MSIATAPAPPLSPPPPVRHRSDPRADTTREVGTRLHAQWIVGADGILGMRWRITDDTVTAARGSDTTGKPSRA